MPWFSKRRISRYLVILHDLPKMDLHVTVHNLILQEVKSFENRLPENGGSRRRIRGSQQSDSWLSFIGLMALIHRSGGSKCVGLSTRVNPYFRGKADFQVRRTSSLALAYARDNWSRSSLMSVLMSDMVNVLFP